MEELSYADLTLTTDYTLWASPLKSWEEFYVKIAEIHSEMRTAINEAIQSWERDFFVRGCPGIGKTTLYCQEITKSDKASLALLPTIELFPQITDRVGSKKKVIRLQTANRERVKKIVNEIDENTAILCTYNTFNEIHKADAELFKFFMKKLGYVFSDEMHRGIGQQTVKALSSITTANDDAEENGNMENFMWDDEEVVVTEQNLQEGLLANDEIIHIGFTGTPTYAHKSVHQHFKCVYHYKTQRGLKDGIIVPIKNRSIGEGLQIIRKEHYTSRDVANAYNEYYIIQNGELKPIKHAVSEELVKLKEEISSMQALGICASIQQMYDAKQACEEKWLRTYLVHSDNKAYKKIWSLVEGKRKIENGEIDIILVCNTGIEWLDIPSLNTVACFYSILSPVKLIQGIGRPGRFYPGKQFAHAIVPPTKIIYRTQPHKESAEKIKREYRESQTVWQINRQDVYYTLDEFDPDFLAENNIYSRDYLEFLNREKKKRMQLEQAFLRIEETATTKLKNLWADPGTLRTFFDLLGIADVREFDKASKKTYEILAKVKQGFIREVPGRRVIYNQRDVTKDISEQLASSSALGKYGISDVFFFSDEEIEKILVNPEDIAGRQKLIISAIPLIETICSQFTTLLVKGKFAAIEVQDLTQESIATITEITQGYKYNQMVKFYEMVARQTFKTILSFLGENNSLMIADKDLMRVFNNVYQQYQRALYVYQGVNVSRIHEDVKNSLIDAFEDGSSQYDVNVENKIIGELDIDQCKTNLLSLIREKRGDRALDVFVSESELPYYVGYQSIVRHYTTIRDVIAAAFSIKPDKECVDFLKHELTQKQFNIIEWYFFLQKKVELEYEKAISMIPIDHQRGYRTVRTIVEKKHPKIYTDLEALKFTYENLLNATIYPRFQPKWDMIKNPFIDNKNMVAEKYDVWRATILGVYRKIFIRLEYIYRKYYMHKDEEKWEKRQASKPKWSQLYHYLDHNEIAFLINIVEAQQVGADNNNYELSTEEVINN